MSHDLKVLLVNNYLDNAATKSAFFIEEIPSTPCALAISFNSATVFELKSLEGASTFFASFFGAAFFSSRNVNPFN